MAGIEPATEAWKAQMLPLHHIRLSDSGGTRTPDQRIRSAMLYPTELLNHGLSIIDLNRKVNHNKNLSTDQLLFLQDPS
jgi:hypothetical protein